MPKTKRKEDATDNAALQAKAQLESIIEMVEALEAAKEDDKARGEAEQAIHEDPLEVAVRSGWYSPGQAHESIGEPEEFKILLCTGGPAVRIVGDLGRFNEPEKARLEYQDWGTPWTEYRITSEEEEKVLTYARQFYFGE